MVDDLSNRMAGVLAVLYLIFNEGYLSTTAASVREDLCGGDPG
jgi:RNA polymerase sigma-70 factor (ECF subfamily)